MMPELANDGVMIVGDAAGLCLNLGYTVRGMDLAIASAQAVLKPPLTLKRGKIFPPRVLPVTNARWRKTACYAICGISANSPD